MLLTLKEVGKLCQEARKERGLYQFHIADRFGCSVSAVSAFETGRSNNAEMLLYYMEYVLPKEAARILGIVKWYEELTRDAVR